MKGEITVVGGMEDADGGWKMVVRVESKDGEWGAGGEEEVKRR